MVEFRDLIEVGGFIDCPVTLIIGRRRPSG
jgi:hypothetical protein